jgi:hypothetical protein
MKKTNPEKVEFVKEELKKRTPHREIIRLVREKFNSGISMETLTELEKGTNLCGNSIDAQIIKKMISAFVGNHIKINFEEKEVERLNQLMEELRTDA